MAENIDILENDILELSPEILKTLLKDHSVSHHDKKERQMCGMFVDVKIPDINLNYAGLASSSKYP